MRMKECKEQVMGEVGIERRNGKRGEEGGE